MNSEKGNLVCEPEWVDYDDPAAPTASISRTRGFEFFLLSSRVHGCRKRKSPCRGPMGEHQGYKIEPAADVRIDRFVYELPHKGMIYGLSPDEINIVEGNK